MQQAGQMGVPMNDVQYAKNWQKDGDYFEREGLYRWMAGRLGDATCVLELGCGSGHGTLALLRAGKRVVAVDENAPSLAITENKLLGAGFRVVRQSSGAEVSSNDPVVLIMTDLLTMAVPSAPFDAFACWNIGGLPATVATHLGLTTQSLGPADMPAYRDRVHRNCFALGTTALSPGGVVHLIDRVGYLNWKDKDDLRKERATQVAAMAGPSYHVDWNQTWMERYERPEGNSQIQYPVSGAAGQVTQRPSTALMSVRAIRV